MNARRAARPRQRVIAIGPIAVPLLVACGQGDPKPGPEVAGELVLPGTPGHGMTLTADRRRR